MQDQLTWNDAEQYLLGAVPSGKPNLPPARLALVAEDLAKGEDSLVSQYMVLRLERVSRASAAFHALSPEKALELAAGVGETLSTMHPDSGKRLDMPLSEKVAELRREMVRGTAHPRQVDDFRKDRGYTDLGEGRGRS